MNYQEALREIWNRSAYDRGFISNPFAGDDFARLGLVRTAKLLEAFGNPQSRFGIIHVAGSKGKGSTCAALSAILTAGGYRTGRYTSPHLHQFRERIAIDNQAMSQDDFAALTERALAATVVVERENPEFGEITAFELVTAMSLLAFADAGCDLAVVEVGLGGTLDATNVVEPLVSIVTPLDFEHTHVLGSTLAEIASNKAGIIKPYRPAITTAQAVPAMEVIVERALRTKSPLYREGWEWRTRGSWRSFTVETPWGVATNLQSAIPGNHQVTNAGAAIVAVHELRTEGYPVSDDAIRTGLAAVVWPGRFEILTRDDKTIVLDGAHTPASAAVLAEAMLAEFGVQKPVVVLGMLNDKDAEAIGEALRRISDRFIVTSPKSARALPIAELERRLSSLPLMITTAPSVAEALRSAADEHDIIVVTGSLSTVADARLALGLAESDPPIE